MAVIKPQSKQGKRKSAKRKLKAKRADIANFGKLSTPQKWVLLESILPDLVELLEDESP